MRLRDRRKETIEETTRPLRRPQNAKELEVRLQVASLATPITRRIAIPVTILTEDSHSRSVVALSGVVVGPVEDPHDGAESGVKTKVDDTSPLVPGAPGPLFVEASLSTTLAGVSTALAPKTTSRKGLAIDLYRAIRCSPAIQDFHTALDATPSP